MGENRFLSESSARDTAVSVFGVMELPEYRYAAVAIHVWIRLSSIPDGSYDRCELRHACGVEISAQSASRDFGRVQSRVLYLTHPTIVLRTLICASVCRQVLGAQVERSASKRE